MRLDLITERSQIAEVNWIERSKYGCSGTTVLAGERFKIKLTKTRFGGGISIYPLRQLTVEEFNAAKGLSNAVPLPDTLLPFVGSTFTVDGAAGGMLRNQLQGIELLDEVPDGAEGTASREALYRKLERQEAIGIFAALGFEWSDSDFDRWEDEVARAEAIRQSRKSE